VNAYHDQDNYIIVVQQNDDASPREDQSRHEKKTSNQSRRPQQIHYKSMSYQSKRNGMESLEAEQEASPESQGNDDQLLQNDGSIK